MLVLIAFELDLENIGQGYRVQQSKWCHSVAKSNLHKSQCSHYYASSHRFRYINVYKFWPWKFRSRWLSTTGTITPFHGKYQHLWKVTLRIAALALVLNVWPWTFILKWPNTTFVRFIKVIARILMQANRFGDIKVWSGSPWKFTLRSLSTTSALVSFDGEINVDKSHYWAFFRQLWPCYIYIISISCCDLQNCCQDVITIFVLTCGSQLAGLIIVLNLYYTRMSQMYKI